ncbi:hypothetical protein QF026_001558 [Streptomyces aurantiacus]|nr:hypothetical protein [Streptomyces aurantiacus]
MPKDARTEEWNGVKWSGVKDSISNLPYAGALGPSRFS